MKLGISIVVLICASIALAQVSTEEAYRRLAERQAQHAREAAGAATQPAEATTRPVARAHPATAPSAISAATTQPGEARTAFLASLTHDIKTPSFQMRAAKNALAALNLGSGAGGDGPVDEEVLNYLGTALDRAGDRLEVKNRVFLDAENAYTALNTRLETTKPGMKRWGITWLKQSDFDAKMSHRQDALRAVDDAQREVDRTKHDLDAAQAGSKRSMEAALGTKFKNASVSSASDVASTKQRYDEAIGRLASAKAAVPRMDWLAIK